MTTTSQSPDTLTGERADLLDSLTRHRSFLTVTAHELTDAQARTRSTASALTIGGLIKHVTATERQWADFIVRGAAALPSFADGAPSDDQLAERASDFELLPGESLGATLAAYAEVAAHTDGLVRELPSLDADHALPAAPWFTPGARWSARRALLHIIAETSQHAGHADIIRETIDGAKTMG